jgi:hypothetical protein
MPNRTLLLSVLVIVGAAALVMRSRVSVVDVQSRVQNIPEIELAPICPWREPQRDLAVFFPSATDYKRETRILSGKRPQMQQRLGRVPTAEENALLIHRITSGPEALGFVLVRRVKGEHGAIEVVTAINQSGAVHAVSIQSQREPDSIAQQITATNWLGAFFGKDSKAPFRVGEDVPEVSSIARASAQAIAEGVRSQLVLLSVAEEREQPGHKTHSHP